MQKDVYIKINELVELLKNQMPNNTTSVTLFINYQGSEIKSTQRTANELKVDCISMRNLKGDWIK